MPQFFVLTSLIFSLYSPSHAEVVDRLEAVVNKKAVYKSDIDQFRSLIGLRSKVDPLFASSAMSKKSSPTDDEIVQFLINEELIAQKYPANDSEVEQEINGIQGNLKIDREGLKQALRAEGFKFDDYFKLMKLSLSKRQLLEREIRSKAAVTEDDIKSEFNKSQFNTKSFQGSFHLFVIRVPKINYKSPTLAKEAAEGYFAAIQKGDSFESVAKTSGDDETSKSGGDLGFLSYADLSPFLQKEVHKLGVGKVSPVLDEGKEFYLIKVTEVKSDRDDGFEKQKDQIRARLMEDEFQHQIGLWIDRQRSTNYIRRNQKAST